MTADQYKKLRNKLGITQVQLAKICQVSKKTISDRERNKVKISKESADFLKNLTL